MVIRLLDGNIVSAVLATGIDTDGSIFLSYHKHGKKQPPSIGTYIAFTNKSKRWLEHLNNDFNVGGRVCPHTKEGVYILLVESKDAILRLLKRVHPYMFIKQKQAELMIFYLLGRNAGKPYSKEDHAMVKEMKGLNRGKR